MRYWLMKSEPDEASIDDLATASSRTLPWTGVRNYQARNFMRDTMQLGDGVLFYHSSCPEPGIAGVVALFGQSSGSVEPFNLGLLAAKGSLYVTRPTLFTYAAKRENLVAMANELFDVVKSGAVKIEVHQTYPLKDAAKAHADLAARKTTGSTVLLV